MNPVVLRVGIAAVIGAAALIYHWLKTRNTEQELSNSGYSCRNVDGSCGTFDGSNISMCCICMEEFKALSRRNEITPLPCKHKFHKLCISLVFKEGGSQITCPVCRARVPESFVSQLF